jgi:hypothetical protein
MIENYSKVRTTSFTMEISPPPLLLLILRQNPESTKRPSLKNILMLPEDSNLHLFSSQPRSTKRSETAFQKQVK